MALIPKITVLAQDLEAYASVVLDDSTGAYNVSTNPGGYGAPNPATGDIVKALVLVTYLGGGSTYVPVTDIPLLQGAGYKLEHPFQEGVQKLTYMPGISLPTNVVALEGNYEFDLVNANSLLADVLAIELDGTVYWLDKSKAFTASKGYVTTAFTKDYTGATQYRYYATDVYTLWNEKGKLNLLKRIGAMACKPLDCTSQETDAVMADYRKYLATADFFTAQDYSKAHNLAVALAPESGTKSDCTSC